MEFENDEKIIDVLNVKVRSEKIPTDKVPHEKFIFDIRAKYRTGIQAIIKIQEDNTIWSKKRAQYDLSKLYANLSASENTCIPEKCYLICITDSGQSGESEEFIKDFRYRDKYGNALADDEIIIIIELDKMESVLKKDVTEMTSAEKWAIFFKYAESEDKRDIIEKISETEDGIKTAQDILIT
jgi:hypothetical protein